MKPRILFVVEGKKVESDHVTKIAEDLFKLTKDDYEIMAYGTTIHTLYRFFTSGNYDSIVSFLSERDPRILPPGLKPNEVYSAIYLIFDFDPQSPDFSSKELLSCAEHFVDETRDGKLYLNYPMFESLRDVPSLKEDDYLALNISTSNLSSSTYKKQVNKRTIFRKPGSGKMLYFIPADKIRFVIHLNEKKYSRVCGLDSKKPWPGTDPSLLLERQLKMMDSQKLIAVLNTLILLIKDYNPNLFPY